MRILTHHAFASVVMCMQLAKKEGVDAVWPGWGHASENPALPQKLSDAGRKQKHDPAKDITSHLRILSQHADRAKSSTCL